MPSPLLSAIHDDLAGYPATAIVTDVLAALLLVVAVIAAGGWLIGVAS